MVHNRHNNFRSFQINQVNLAILFNVVQFSEYTNKKNAAKVTQIKKLIPIRTHFETLKNDGILLLCTVAFFF